MRSDDLLSPVTTGHVGAVADDAVLAALVRSEIALVEAWSAAGVLPGAEAERIGAALGRRAPTGGVDLGSLGIDVHELARSAVADGNPVVPLVPLLKDRVPAGDRLWVHRGATSQDILDTALMLVARDAVAAVLDSLAAADAALAALEGAHGDVVAAARTLGQHAVPTTLGRRIASWRAGTARAAGRLRGLSFPAQLGGAAGTRAAFHEIAGDAAAGLPARYAESLGLHDAGAPWHTSRWPVTELGDALTQTTDALGKFATDVVTLTRTEIGELSVGPGGGSSAMPQKNNPVAAILIRSAALRAPQLAATLHLCAADAADERPVGAWHAEWPAVLDLLGLALGVAAHAAELAAALQVDRAAVDRNLQATRGLLLAERVSIVLTPLVGADRVKQVVAEAAAGADLGDLIRSLPEARDIDVDSLLDPAEYTGPASPEPATATAPASRSESAHPADGER